MYPHIVPQRTTLSDCFLFSLSKLLIRKPSLFSLSGVLDFKVLAGCVDILVSSSTAVENHPHTVRQCWAELLQVSQRVGCLQGRDDALQPRGALESCMRRKELDAEGSSIHDRGGLSRLLNQFSIDQGYHQQA